MTPPERVGLANTTYFIALDFGLGFGPFILGSIVAAFGYSGLYFILSIFVLAIIPIYLFLHGRKDKYISQ